MPIVSVRLSAMHGSARRSPNRNWLSVWEPTSHISLVWKTAAWSLGLACSSASLVLLAYALR